jgi:hypothetical protein
MKGHLFLGTVGALAVLYFLLGIHPIWDVDVFWHIAAGRWMAAEWALPTRDIFSAVDPGRVWVPFQWLYEVTVWGVDGLFGLLGVRLLHGALAGLAVGFFGGWLGRSRGAAVGLFGAAVLAFLFADRLRVRPDLFNLLFLVLLWPLVEGAGSSRRREAAVVVLAALWANVHAGGALLVPVLLGARCAGRAVDGWLNTGRGGRLPAAWAAARGDLAVLLAAGVAMCVMPGFLRGVYQAFFMLGPSEQFIPEWMTSVEFLLDHAQTPHEWVAGALPLGLMAGFLALAANRVRRVGLPPGLFHDLALAVPLVALSLLHVRFLWLAAFVVPIAVRYREPRVPAGPPWTSWRPLAAVVAALLLLGADVHYHVVRNGGGFGPYVRGLGQDLADGYFPEGATDFLVRNGFQGRILNHAAWGGFLLHPLFPRVRVYSDGRGNFGPVESRLLATWDNPLARRRAIEEAWREAPFEAIVHPAPFPFLDADCRAWVRVYHDPVAQVWLRAGDPNMRNWKALGAELPAGSGYGVSESCALHRAFGRVSAVRRLAAGERLWERARATARLAAGDEAARLALAAVHYDLGDYRRVRELLADFADPATSREVNGTWLYLMAELADGYRRQAMAHRAGLALRLRGDAEARRRISPRVIPVLESLGDGPPRP